MKNWNITLVSIILLMLVSSCSLLDRIQVIDNFCVLYKPVVIYPENPREQKEELAKYNDLWKIKCEAVIVKP